MRELTIFNSLTLDGVMQAPGDANEDRRGGFAGGGWALPYQDEVMGRFAADGMSEESSLLFGRWTYESFHSYWPTQEDNPYTEVLNRSTKYVASRSADITLPWENSVLLHGEAAESVTELKATEGNDILVMGSGELCQTLIRHELVDRYILLLHPLLLGSGKRLFPERHHARLDLVDVTPTTTGVLIAAYVGR